MLGTYYYHEILRKTVIAFGTLFNDIHVRHEGSNNKSISDLKVALAYGPMQKFLARIEQQPDLNRATQITLPRMSFEMNNIAYDPTRKSGITQTFKASDGSKLRKVFMPVPYNVDFELAILAKNQDDGLQILEQILPIFQPMFTVTINLVDAIGEKKDFPIILNGVSYDDDYEGDFTTRRTLIYTLTFSAKTYLYGPVPDISSKVIKKSIVDTHLKVDTTAAREVRYTVTPDPLTAEADDDFGFNEIKSEWQDGKARNPVTGQDE